MITISIYSAPASTLSKTKLKKNEAYKCPNLFEKIPNVQYKHSNLSKKTSNFSHI